MARQTTWTKASIRQAMRLPKPKGICSRLEKLLRAAAAPSHLTCVLSHIAENATIIDDGRVLHDADFHHNGMWMLIPMSFDIFDTLAELGAAAEDLEEADEPEEVGDREPDDFEEVTLTEDVRQDVREREFIRLAPQTDDEDDDGTAEPEDAAKVVWAPDWWPWTLPAPEFEDVTLRRSNKIPVRAASE